jgi:hypothetical protein
VQFHPEVDLATFQLWIDDNDPLLGQSDIDASSLLHRVALLQDDLFEVWHPFATRFAVLATGAMALPAPGRGLPLLGS